MVLLALVAGLTAMSFANKSSVRNKKPDQVQYYQWNNSAGGKKPVELRIDPSKYGRAEMVNIKLPNPARPDLDTMVRNERLLADPVYNASFQTLIDDRNGTKTKYGIWRLKDPLFCGDQNRFGPQIRMKRPMQDPRDDPDFEIKEIV